MSDEVIMVRASRPKKCPKCKHEPMQLCVIGHPRIDEEYFSDKYYLLGCVAPPPWPKWHCSECDLFIHKRSDLKTSNSARFTDINVGYQVDPEVG